MTDFLLFIARVVAFVVIVVLAVLAIDYFTGVFSNLRLPPDQSESRNQRAPSAGDEDQAPGPEGRGLAGPPRGTVVSAPPESINTFQHAEGPSHCAGRGGTYVKSARHPGNGRVIHNCSY